MSAPSSLLIHMVRFSAKAAVTRESMFPVDWRSAASKHQHRMCIAQVLQEVVAGVLTRKLNMVGAVQLPSQCNDSRDKSDIFRAHRLARAADRAAFDRYRYVPSVGAVLQRLCTPVRRQP